MRFTTTSALRAAALTGVLVVVISLILPL